MPWTLQYFANDYDKPIHFFTGADEFNKYPPHVVLKGFAQEALILQYFANGYDKLIPC